MKNAAGDLGINSQIKSSQGIRKKINITQFFSKIKPDLKNIYIYPLPSYRGHYFNDTPVTNAPLELRVADSIHDH